MLSPEIKKKIREIEIYTRRLISGSFVGDTTSAVKGSGIEFDQIREYQMGDDVRFIDWNSSARMNKLLVKQYFEERNRTMLLAVDISGSGFFSSTSVAKMDAMAQLASALALVADYGKDRVGLLLFSDEVELFIPPGRGRVHVHRIMEQLFLVKTCKKKTNINCALERIAQLKESNTMVFVISDFIDDNFDKNLLLVAQKHDLIAVRFLDSNEKSLPSVGFITVQDMETGQEHMLDMRSVRSSANRFLGARVAHQDTLFKRCGIDVLEIKHDTSFISDVVFFFRRRMMY